MCEGSAQSTEMARKARLRVEGGLYYVCERRNDRQDGFHDDEEHLILSRKTRRIACLTLEVRPLTVHCSSLYISLSLASGICLRYYSSHPKKSGNLGAATTCPKRIRVRRRLSAIRYAERFPVSRSGYQLSTISYQLSVHRPSRFELK